MDKPKKYKRVGHEVESSKVFLREDNKKLSPELVAYITKFIKDYNESRRKNPYQTFN